MDAAQKKGPLEIVAWGKHFENNRSKTVLEARWVPIPNRHDGLKFSRMMAHKDGAVLFSAWILIVQVASKCPKRGVLTNGDGRPLTIDDIAFITRAPRRWFEMAISYLLEVRWMQYAECKSLTLNRQATDSELTPDCQATDSKLTPCRHEGAPSRARAEWNGMEWNGIPPTVPLGGQESAVPTESSEPVAETAKKRVCRILGRDPKRPIAFEAMAELGRICPIPEEEFELIEWFYGLPDGDPKEDPELSWRRKDFTKLILHWIEEVDRARAYREKKGAGKKSAEKKEEPVGWLETARALWPGADLPDSFWKLSPDVQREIQNKQQTCENEN